MAVSKRHCKKKVLSKNQEWKNNRFRPSLVLKTTAALKLLSPSRFKVKDKWILSAAVTNTTMQNSPEKPRSFYDDSRVLKKEEALRKLARVKVFVLIDTAWMLIILFALILPSFL